MSSNLVLVVDASATDRENTCGIVARAGFEPIPLPDGERCMEELAKRDVLMVLMDLSLGKLSGDECCRMIKERFTNKPVPVVMSTAAQQPHEVMYCWRAAADDFLPKPIVAEHLAAKLTVIRDASNEQATRARPLEGKSLLLAESSRFYRHQIGHTLEQAGLRILYATEGEEAIELGLEHAESLDMALIDVLLPGTSGLLVAETLRKNPSFGSKPLVLLSGHGALSEPDLARAERVSGAPPFDKRLLPFELVLSKVYRQLRHQIDLRTQERMPFFSVVEFSRDFGWDTGFSYDVSTGGIFVRTLTPLPVNTPLKLRMRFAGEHQPAVSSGIVAWSNPYRPRSSFAAPVGMGIRLLEPAPQLLSQISFLLRTNKSAPGSQ